MVPPPRWGRAHWHRDANCVRTHALWRWSNTRVAVLRMCLCVCICYQHSRNDIFRRCESHSTAIYNYASERTQTSDCIFARANRFRFNIIRPPLVRERTHSCKFDSHSNLCSCEYVCVIVLCVMYVCVCTVHGCMRALETQLPKNSLALPHTRASPARSLSACYSYTYNMMCACAWPT